VADYLSCGPVKTDPVQCLKQVALEPGRYLDRTLSQGLSGGERRRIELAAVLSLNSRLAILDEPNAGIDSALLPYIEKAIPALRERGAAVLLACSAHPMPPAMP
jgi:Fe-S cluster assembly ATP-binding protein